MRTKETVSTILVSGASGFLGSELLKQLIEDGNYNVIAISSKKESLITKFGSSPQFKVIRREDWKNEIDQDIKIDILVNCAFPRSSDPEQLAKGLVYTENLIRESIDLNIKKIINISSQSVYSQKEKSLADEKTPIIPESLYGMTKYSSERIIAVLCENSNDKVFFSNIRLGSLSGVGLKARMTNRFVKHALKGQPIIINGGNQKVSYLDVRDAASALIAMMNKDSSLWNQVYNLGNYDYCTVLELAEIVKDVAKEYTIDNVKLEIREEESNFSNLINSELFYNDFKWRPYYTIELMVKELFEYYTIGI